MLKLFHKSQAKKQFTSSGFTLVELLVVMMIIGILAAISVFTLQSSRLAGRDGKRKSDLETIRSALELFKADCGVYPASLPAAGSSLTGSAALGCSPANTNTYISSVPNDPRTTATNYIYRRITNSTYELCADLEQNPPTAVPCSAGGDFRVTNP